MSSVRNRYSSEELSKIRGVLQDVLGASADDALHNLDQRFTPSDVEEEEKEAEEGEDLLSGSGKKSSKKTAAVDVATVIREGKIPPMLEALSQVQEEPKEVRALVAAILKHRSAKAFHLVEALGKVNTDEELVNALSQGILSRKGVNPIIEALRYAVISPSAMKSLAMGIADQGTVNHVLRAIASSPKNQHEVEVIFAMEVMGKGSVEQMLEAMNLMDDNSPGTVILATGLVHRQEVGVEPLVRGLSNCRSNARASTLLAVKLVSIVDTQSLVSLLEKYVDEKTEVGEIVATKFVYNCLHEKRRGPLLVKACRKIRSNSMTGRILSIGLIKLGDVEAMQKAFQALNFCPSGRDMIALALIKKRGKIMAMRALGKAVWETSKNASEINGNMRKALERYEGLIQGHLKASIEQAPPATEGASSRQRRPTQK
ncbi:hypothetical protein ACQZV8_09540 [Magnetococcales bacterium HHB-1]